MRETKRLREVIDLMRSGNQLYQQAQERISDRELQAIFSANLRDRKQILDVLRNLSPEVDYELAGGDSSLDGADFHMNRAHLLAVLKDNQAAVYARQLADLETATERSFSALAKLELDAEAHERLRGLKFDFERIRNRSATARTIAWNREAPTTLPTRMMR